LEVKRQLDLLDKNLASNRFLCGEDYNIADIANYPWYGAAVLHNLYDAAEFLDVASYKNVIRWATEIEERPAVQRGRRVNRIWGPQELRVPERHSADDFKI
jgi:GST-like protein